MLGNTSDSLTVFKRTPDARIRELLGVVNYFVAPFGTQEQLVLNYGVKDRDYTLDARGNSIFSQTDTGEVTTLARGLDNPRARRLRGS